VRKGTISRAACQCIPLNRLSSITQTSLFEANGPGRGSGVGWSSTRYDLRFSALPVSARELRRRVPSRAAPPGSECREVVAVEGRGFDWSWQWVVEVLERLPVRRALLGKPAAAPLGRWPD